MAASHDLRLLLGGGVSFRLSDTLRDIEEELELLVLVHNSEMRRRNNCAHCVTVDSG